MIYCLQVNDMCNSKFHHKSFEYLLNATYNKFLLL